MISSYVVTLLTSRNLYLRLIIIEHNHSETAYLLQSLDNNFENILILTCKIVQNISEDIYRKKQ